MLNAACKFIVFIPSHQGVCSFRFGVTLIVLKVHKCVHLCVFAGL